MKNVTRLFGLTFLVCLVIACSKEDSELDKTFPFLSIDEFNQKFYAGELGTSEQNAVAILMYDEAGVLVSNERYQKEAKKHSEKWETRFAPLAAFEALGFDDFNASDYIRTIPMGKESAMHIYDGYEIPSKKLTSKEEIAQVQTSFSKLNEKDVVCSRNRLTPGDVFFEFGRQWGGNCADGSTRYGRLSIVHGVDHAHSERLDAIQIGEASYTIPANNPNAFIPGKVVITFANQVYEPNKACSNYWNAIKLGDVNYTTNEGGTISGISAVQWYNVDEENKPYGYSAKKPGRTRPNKYYSSLYVWEAYQEITGKDLDVNGGTVVSPNDFVLAARDESTWDQIVPPLPDPWFEICDF